MVKKNSAAKNISCEEKCQSAMAVSTEFVTNKAEIAKVFEKNLKLYEDYEAGAAATARELDIKQGTEEMQYLLDYIYNRTGVIVGYWNDSLFISGETFLSFMIWKIKCHINKVVDKSNYPTMAFDGADTRSLKEYIAKELFVDAYHENSKRFFIIT